MMKYYVVVWSWATATFLLACTENRARDIQGSQSQTIADAGSSPSETSNPPPIADTDPNCEAFVATAIPLSTTRVMEQASTRSCATEFPSVAADGSPSHDLYASCTPIGSSPAQCVLAAGMQYCEAGLWTALCSKNGDCPGGTLCLWANGVGDVPPEYHPPFGTCQKACSSVGSAECGRCDLECNTSMSVCVKRRSTDPNPQACRADCDCLSGVCESGLCTSSGGRPRIGLCGVPGGDCVCKGGTCVAGCCIPPSGDVDDGTGPVCTAGR